MAAEAPLLEIDGLRVVFSSPDEADIEAVRRVDLTVPAGRTVCLVGESGCGKSVTARAILKLLDPNARIAGGAIRFTPRSGRTVDLAAFASSSLAMRQVRGREIAMIFQEPMSSLSPVHSIGSQIDEMLMLHEKLGRRAARARTLELLDQVGISGAGRADAYPFQLSGGLRQRAMIAMALACRPSLLIADEPTTALDVTTQAQILELLRRLQGESGMAMLFITHDLGVVAEIADSVAVMYLGEVVEKGGVFELFRSPSHPYTQALMTSVPRVARKAERHRLSPIRGAVPSPAERPPGCTFHARCPAAIEPLCHDVPPGTTPVEAGHSVRCHLRSRTAPAAHEAVA